MTKIRLLLSVALATVIALTGAIGPTEPLTAVAAPSSSKAALKATVKVDKKAKLTFSSATYSSSKRVAVAKFSTGYKGRPASLQYKDGTKWKVAASGTMDAKGRVTFSVKSLHNLSYRAVADTHKVKKKTIKPSATATVKPTPAAAPAPSVEALKASLKLDKKSTLTFSPVNYGGKHVTVASFSTGYKGRFVTLQYKDGKKWKVAASGTMDAKGRVTFVTTSVKNTTYRAVADTHLAKKKTIKPSASITIKPGSQWTSTFKDDFSGTKLNKAWTTPGAFYTGSRLCSAPDPKMTKVKDGKLVASVRKLDSKVASEKKTIKAVIKAAKTEQQKRKDAALKATKKLKGAEKKTAVAAAQAMQVNGCPHGVYSNAYLDTRESFHQAEGIIATKAKFPKQQAIHGSIWLQSTRPSNASPMGAEIDMIESFGYGKGITNLVHTDGGGTGKINTTGGYVLKNETQNPKWWDKYHVYSVEWTRSEFVFRIDGVETNRIKKNAVKGDQYTVMVTLLSSDWELPLLKKPVTSKKTPGVKKPDLTKAKMYVDWIEVWARS